MSVISQLNYGWSISPHFSRKKTKGFLRKQDGLSSEKVAKYYFQQRVCKNDPKIFCLFSSLRLAARADFALKGQPIFMQLLRCKALAVEYHSGAPHALHLHKPRLLRKAG